MLSKMKGLNSYRIAILLSSISMMFGIFREFLIVALFGFTARNDELQLYLSIFYTIGLTIDAMRLSCLNLYAFLSLPRILFSASIVGLPFAIVIGFVMSYSTGGLNSFILLMTMIGSYLNLIASLLITYKQRNNIFLAAQLINVMPNIIIIPGMLVCYWFAPTHVLFAIILLTSITPLVQCTLLLLLPSHSKEKIQPNSMSLLASVLTFVRHFSAMLGEQIFQIITRTAFYNYGVGYLSVFAIVIRLYSAVRFILIDSFIGSRLANWQSELHPGDYYLSKMINLTSLGIVITAFSLYISMQASVNLIYSSIQIIVILMFGFYFSTLVRVIYYKINRYENNSLLIMRFAMFEFICAMISLILTKQLNCPILALLWVGYIAKPFAQLLLLRRKYHGLAVS